MAVTTTAIAEWTRILGPENAILRADELAEAEATTFATSNRVACILRPLNREQVVECVQVARQFKSPLYPFSSGKNWGYGSRVPPAGGCALLDLSRMNRILEVNEELGFATVEPGVTQAQLLRHLREKNLRLWIDATGSSPDCSLIGNAMERGFGHTPYADHFANTCGLEVVTGTGDVIETGYAGLLGAKAAAVFRSGVGPTLDGLFSQSNFGIVTRMTVWLMPEPEYFQAFFFLAESEDSIGALVEAIRPLRLNGVLGSAVHIANDYRVLSGLQQFPAGAAKPLSPEELGELRRNLKFGAWSGSGALYGTRGQVAEARRIMRKALAGKASKLNFLDQRTMRMALRFAGPYRILTGLDLRRTLELARPVFDLMRGIPSRSALRSAYWRKPGAAPADPDPDRDRCGLMWFAPIAPLTGSDALAVSEISKRIILRHGFEPMISMTAVTGRSLACVISISYDRDVSGEDERALRCYSDLQLSMQGSGYYPYRLGIQGMRLLERDPGTARALKSIKDALDPDGILAPGRYIPT
ncbi:MAG: FAD-binding oxidoreductase [Acidobacteriota bacterium]|nr:FAD-binding oxidoreductase [Acidobacteriota bacterium]